MGDNRVMRKDEFTQSSSTNYYDIIKIKFYTFGSCPPGLFKPTEVGVETAKSPLNMYHNKIDIKPPFVGIVRILPEQRYYLGKILNLSTIRLSGVKYAQDLGRIIKWFVNF